MTKRIISMLLILTMLISTVPTAAFAETPTTGDQPSVDTGEVTLKGTNSFGTLLTEDITQQQEQLKEEAQSGYTVTGLEFDGATATVTYDTLEEATLVVALYAEDGMQLLTSGTTTVQPEETTAFVTIEGEMPQYFMASAYLLDTYDFSPLCPAYDTPLYTQEMQELLNSTVDDYAPDRVLNLDDDPTTNFAVYADTTKVIEGSDGVNTVISSDDMTRTYVIGNADESITGLQVGDVFSYPYADGEILIVKVQTISVDGSTVTITGGDVELEQIFSHMKVEGGASAEDMTVDDSTATEGIHYIGTSSDKEVLLDVSEAATTLNSSGEGVSLTSSGKASTLNGSDEDEPSTNSGISETFSHEFSIDPIKIESKTDGLTVSATIEGGIKFSLKIGISYYISVTQRYFEFKMDPAATVYFTIKGTIDAKLLIGSCGVMPIPGVYVGFDPTIHFKFSGTVSTTLTWSVSLGFRYDKEIGTQNISTAPKFEPGIELQGTLFVGIDLHPNLKILDDDILKLSLTALMGLEIKGNITGYGYEIPQKDPDEQHLCEECLGLSLTFKGELSGELKILDQDWLTIEVKFLDWSIPLGSAYWSVSKGEFGAGACPNKSFRVTVELVKMGLDVQLDQIEVKLADGQSLGKTNAGGILVVYLPAGEYWLTAEKDTFTGYHQLVVEGACKAQMWLNAESSTEEQGQQTILGTITGDKEAAGGFQSTGTVIASGTCGTNVYWKLYSGGLLDIYGVGAMTDFSSSSPVQWNRSIIKHIIIENGVTNIGRNAFKFCYSLTSVTIPRSVTSIGDYAFYECTNMTCVTIPEGVTSIGNYAFKNCTNLTSVTIREGVTSIGDYAFEYCTSLTGVTIPESVTFIGSGAFYGCTRVTDIYLSDISAWLSISFEDVLSNPFSASDLDKHLYQGGMLITDLVIPEGVTSIGNYAFSNYTRLASVTIPKGVTRIGDHAFSYCTSLTSATVPEGMTTIGDYAFSGCSSLTGVTIPEGVTTIGDYAFCNCTSLTSVTIPEGVTTIGSSAFTGCSSLTSATIPEGVTRIDVRAFCNCTSLTSVTIPEGVTTIGNNAFSGCSSLTGVTIPESVTFIGSRAFNGCTRVTDIYLSDISAWLSISFGDNYSNPFFVSNWDKHLYLDGKLIADLVIPEGVTSIGSYAFRDCTNLTSVTISGSVTTIGNCAFKDCANLTCVTIPEGVTSIGSYAFENCTSLTDIYITDIPAWLAISFGSYYANPLNSNSLEKRLYLDGELITDLVIPEGVSSIGDYAFYYCTSLTSVTIPEGVTTIGSNAFRDCTSLTSATILEGVTTIGSNAFRDCTSLTSVTIPGSVTTIGDHAFRDCTSLTSVTILEGVTSIGSCAFSDCTSLTSVTIPESVTTIGSDAFSGCSSLTSATIPEGVTRIGDRAFQNCTSLSSVMIADSVTRIGDRAFQNCTSLTSVTIPDSVTSIGDRAFSSCTSMTDILFSGDHPGIYSNAFSDVKATAYYPADNTTWTSDMMQNYGGTLTWVPYTSEETFTEAVTLNTSRDLILEDEVSVEMERLDAVYGGEYGNEVSDTYTNIKTATFTDLVPGQDYVLLALASLEIDAPLGTDNLLFIDQGTAAEDGTLEFKYVQRVDTALSYVMACGASNKDLADAVITFPDMVPNGETQVVDPEVVYDGETLEEGRDYVILGDVDFTDAGTYTCYIRGIYQYAGLVECTYHVMVVPTLELSYPTLSFEDEIFYNVYYTVSDTTSVVEMGLMVLPSRDDSATIDDAISVVPGYITNGSVFLAKSEGVAAANMGDALYFKVYAKLTDGSYAYSTAGGYNAKAYANSILSGNNSDEMKSLVVSMLNYGAQAQLYFGHNTDKLVNNALTTEQQTLVAAYDSSMMDAIVKADTAKTADFVRVSSNFKQLYPSVSFDSAFAINFYCQSAITVDSGMTLYYWDMATMEAVDKLSLDNATGSMEMVATGDVYWGQVPGIAAKDMDKTYYVTCVFESGGETITTGIIPYTLGKYCTTKADTDGDALQAFAQATAVYGYYAKQYFASIA